MAKAAPRAAKTGGIWFGSRREKTRADATALPSRIDRFPGLRSRASSVNTAASTALRAIIRDEKESVREDWRIAIPAQELTSHIRPMVGRARFTWGLWKGVAGDSPHLPGKFLSAMLKPSWPN
jgi:hypothetical protein